MPLSIPFGMLPIQYGVPVGAINLAFNPFWDASTINAHRGLLASYTFNPFWDASLIAVNRGVKRKK